MSKNLYKVFEKDVQLFADLRKIKLTPIIYNEVRKLYQLEKDFGEYLDTLPSVSSLIDLSLNIMHSLAHTKKYNEYHVARNNHLEKIAKLSTSSQPSKNP